MKSVNHDTRVDVAELDIRWWIAGYVVVGRCGPESIGGQRQNISLENLAQIIFKKAPLIFG